MKVKNARAAELSDLEVLEVLREMDRAQRAAVLHHDDRRKSAVAKEAGLTAPHASSSSIVAATPIASIRLANGQSEAPDTDLSLEERTMLSLPSNLRTIQYELLASLRHAERPCAHQTPQQIPRFLDAIHAWERGRPVAGVVGLDQEDGDDEAQGPPLLAIERDKRLTKGERLMLLNHAPTSEIELFPLIEEIEFRFSDDQRRDLLNIVAAYLPLDQTIIANTKGNEPSTAVVDSDMVKLPVEVGQDDEAGADDGIVDEDDEMEGLENEQRNTMAVEEEEPDE